MSVETATLDKGEPLTVRRSAAERAGAIAAGDRIVVALPARSPVADFSLDWWRLDEEGSRAGGGRWPDPALEEALARPDAQRRVLAIAPAETVAIHWLAMSDLAPRQARVAAQLKVLDEAAGSPGDLHVVAGEPRASDGAFAVAVVDRAVMTDWLDWCGRHRIDPDAVIPAALLLPEPIAGSVFRATLGDETLFRGEDSGWQSDEEIDSLLIGDDAVVDVEADALDAGLAAAFDHPVVNLRVGVFAKRRRGVDGALVRRVIAILLACGVAELLIAVVLVARFSLAADALDRDASALAAPAVSSGTPVERLVPTLDAELARRGSGPNSFSVPAAGLYGALAATTSAIVSDLSYTPDGTLTANVSAPTAEELNAVLLALQRDGFTVSYTQSQGADGRQAIALTVRGSPL